MKREFTKISLLQYLGFHKRYFAANYQPLRLGQAFCNEFEVHPDAEVDNIYNELSVSTAEEIIYANYVAE